MLAWLDSMSMQHTSWAETHIRREDEEAVEDWDIVQIAGWEAAAAAATSIGRQIRYHMNCDGTWGSSADIYFVLNKDLHIFSEILI